MATSNATRGRPRDAGIDDAVLAAARDQLATCGYEAMSVVAVAEQAGTTRQALYRRWSSKADLATAAIASLAQFEERSDSDDPFDDLLIELRSFHRSVTRPNGVGMIGAMLQEATDADLRTLYRERVVAPRRRRIRSILDRAHANGTFTDDADIEYAVAASTGTLYALHLAGADIADTWPERTAAMIWRSLGAAPTTQQKDERGTTS